MRFFFLPPPPFFERILYLRDIYMAYYGILIMGFWWILMGFLTIQPWGFMATLRQFVSHDQFGSTIFHRG